MFCQNSCRYAYEESADRIAIVILLGVYTRACGAICSHRLISILSEVKDILLLVVVYTLDHLWTDQRAFRNDSFEGYHVVEMSGAESSRLAGEFPEASNVGAVVHLSIGSDDVQLFEL